MTRSELQCDWLARFVTTPDWQAAAARAVDEMRRIGGLATENELDSFILGEEAPDRPERAFGFANKVRCVNSPLAVAFELLALHVADSVSDIRSTVSSAIGLVGLSSAPNADEAKHRLQVWLNVAAGKHSSEWTDFFDCADMYWDDQPPVRSGIGHPVELLLQDRWDLAFSWLIKATESHFERRQREIPEALLDASDRKAWPAVARAFADDLSRIGRGWSGELGIAWLMMTVDPKEPMTFNVVLPIVDWLMEHHSIITSPREKVRLRARLDTWWKGAEGEWADSEVSIFRIAFCETEHLEFEDPDVTNAAFASMRHAAASKLRQHVGPSVVVINGKHAEECGLPTAWRDLRDQALLLVVATDVARLRAALYAEYPHAHQAIDLLMRDLREGHPVRIRPTLLVGPPGGGKSRLVRRLADMLKLYVYRYDGAAAHDATYGGSPKAWSSAQPSVPARAIMTSRTANPISMVDEIEKGGTSTYNGNLWNAMMPFLERETSARYRESGLDAELDLSHVNHVATANTVEPLPAPLRDRFRLIRIPNPTMAHLPALAAQVMRDLAIEDAARYHDEPLAQDELDVIGRAWAREKFSMRKLQRLVGATLDARDFCARRH